MEKTEKNLPRLSSKYVTTASYSVTCCYLVLQVFGFNLLLALCETNQCIHVTVANCKQPLKPTAVIMKLSSFLIFLLTAAAGQSEAFHPTSTAITKSSSVRDGKRHQAIKPVKLSEPTPMSFRGGSSLEMSSASSIVTTLVPRIGILTSTLLYFSPFTAVRQASSSDSLNDLNPVPLAIMAVSSLCWLVYGLSVRDPYVTLSNVPGCIASIWYVVAGEI